MRNTQLSSNNNLTLCHTNKPELSIFIIDFEKTNEKIKDFWVFDSLLGFSKNYALNFSFIIIIIIISGFCLSALNGEEQSEHQKQRSWNLRTWADGCNNDFFRFVFLKGIEIPRIPFCWNWILMYWIPGNCEENKINWC